MARDPLKWKRLGRSKHHTKKLKRLYIQTKFGQRIRVRRCETCLAPGHRKNDLKCPLNPNNRAPTSPSGRGFLERFPPELRLKIYQPLIEEAIQNELKRTASGTTKRNKGPELLAIMETCRTIYNELKEAFWDQMPMSICTTRLPRNLLYCIKKTGAQERTYDALFIKIVQNTKIRDLFLAIRIIERRFPGTPAQEEIDEVEFYELGITRLFKMLSLAKRIENLYIYPVYRPHSDEPLAPFLRALANIRNLPNVGRITLQAGLEEGGINVWKMVNDIKKRVNGIAVAEDSDSGEEEMEEDTEEDMDEEVEE